MPSKIFSFLKRLSFGSLFFWSFQVFSADWRDPQWLKLGHYNKSSIGTYLSETDGPAFFLHPKGKMSPSKELKEFIHQLDAPVKNPDEHVYCRFPARWRWFKAKNKVRDPSIECPKLNAFRKRVDAHSVAIVFSSYYLNNPSSSFGHTFLRLGRSPKSILSGSKPTELLDTGINYGAVTGDAGPVLYTLGGLTGLFPGTFNAIPYYYKVREYNDYETRDLWSYELTFSKEEIDFIVDHIWELGHTFFNYYFLTENCSYHMLTILEAARPDLNLRQHLPRLYTIPSDTLKALDKENLIASVTFRASPSSLFNYLIDKTSKKEKELIKKLSTDPELDVPLENEKKVLIYDAAISLIDFKHAKEILKGKASAQKLKRPLLLARSKIPLRSPDPDFSFKLPSAPHVGHGSRRIMIGTHLLNDKIGTDLSWRFAFHDLLDHEVSYPVRSGLEVGNISLRSYGHKIQVREVEFVDVLNFGKIDSFNHSPSWKIRLGHWKTRLDKKDYSTQGFSGGYGYSYHFNNLVPFLLLQVESSYVSEHFRRIKLAYGSDLGLFFDFNEKWKGVSTFELRAHPWKDEVLMNELRYTQKKFGTGFYFSDDMNDEDTEFGLRFYSYF